MKVPSRKDALDNVNAQHKKNTAPPVVGQVMSDGTIFSGKSTETGTLLFALPQDAEGAKTYTEAKDYINSLNTRRKNGHDDWAIPTPGELRLLFAARDTGAFKNTFNTASKNGKNAWYWSSAAEYEGKVWTYACGGTMMGVAVYHEETSNLRCIRRKKGPLS